MNKLLQPIWFRLSKRFYRKLDTLADSIGLPAEDALELAVDLLGRVVVVAQRNETGPKEFVDRFWKILRRQQKTADTYHVSVVDALEDAVKLYQIYGPLAMPVPPHGDLTPARSAPRALGLLYWATVPAEERSRRARDMARKRWDARKALPKAAGDDVQR